MNFAAAATYKIAGAREGVPYAPLSSEEEQELEWGSRD